MKEDWKGLSQIEVRERLEAVGPNLLPGARRRGYWKTTFDALKEPMLLLLVACASIYLVIGDLGEGILLLFSCCLIIAISVSQQRKTEGALDALKTLSSPRATVIRESNEQVISAAELVPGDLIVVNEGDRIPADAEVLSSNFLSVDESLLTGESDSIRKLKEMPIFMGTLAVRGHGLARVNETGSRTRMGRIGGELNEIETDQSPVRKEVTSMVRKLAIGSLIFSWFIAVAYRWTRGDWTGGILAGLTAAISIIPEEIPMVLTLFLALGAWRLSKKNVLCRHFQALESIGSITVLCVDKTGTLTENRMTIRELRVKEAIHQVQSHDPTPLPEVFHPVVEYGVLASRTSPVDPMEKAFHRLLRSPLVDRSHLHEDWLLLEEYPLSDELFATSFVWKKKEGGKFEVATKGAPEAILDLCHETCSPLADVVAAQTREMSEKGLRVIGVAKAEFEEQNLPRHQHDFEFRWLGLVGLEDPLREEVRGAVQECAQAGIRVVMMTGDHPGTALKIANQAGISSESGAIEGAFLSSLPEAELKARVKKTNVYARVLPEQKLYLVNAFKADGERVAMTGDGVNDAPALRAADIGIGMGQRGTEVAREASDVVLMDDRFSSIVKAIEQGRLISENLSKALDYIFSIHVPIAGICLFPILMGWPLLLAPIHIVFLQLVIDPSCTLIYESAPPPADLMKQPPRPVAKNLFHSVRIRRSLLQGLALLIILVLNLLVLHRRGLDFDSIRTANFFALVLMNVGMVAIHLDHPGRFISHVKLPKYLWGIFGGVMFMLMLFWLIAPLRRFFSFGPFDASTLVLAVLVGLTGIALAYGLRPRFRPKVV